MTVMEGTLRLGVSERRVLKLAREARVRGAIKAGAGCLVPTPADLIPGMDGPSGDAGREG